METCQVRHIPFPFCDCLARVSFYLLIINCLKIPVCIAKTQYSFSCDPKAKGVPTGFRIFVREIRSCVGAGFLYPICECI